MNTVVVKDVTASDIQVVDKTNGRWVAGQSGNPKGRPPTIRDEIATAKQKLEQFIRGKIDPDKAVKAVCKLVDAAAEGDVKAAAVIMPYLLSKSTGIDDTVDKGAQGITIRIENATIKAQREHTPIDGEFKEIKDNGSENNSDS